MKKLLAALLLCMGSAQAAQLSAGLGIEFLVLNGKAVESISEDADKKIELTPGKYQLVARYERSLKRGSKKVLFTSSPYVFELDVAADDLLLAVPRMRSQTQAEAFFNHPKWELIVGNRSNAIDAVELEGTGFASFANITEVVAAYNTKHNKPTDLAGVAALEQPLINVAAKGTPAPTSDNLAQLQQWYNKASVSEKKAFKRWMIEQDF